MNDTNAPLLTGANPLPYRLSAGMGKDFLKKDPNKMKVQMH